MFDKINNNQRGFTLVEMLISLAIFGLLSLAVAAIYISYNNTQVRTTVSQKLLNDSQYAIELMAREIRNSKIVDYAPDANFCNSIIHTSSNIALFNNCIVLERENGQTFAFTSYDYTYNSLDLTKLLYVLLDCNNDYTLCSDVDFTDYGTYTSVLEAESNNINIEELDFYVTPSTDPFVLTGPDKQPKVTIKMNTSYISTNQLQNVKHTFQTTVSSKIYKR